MRLVFTFVLAVMTLCAAARGDDSEIQSAIGKALDSPYCRDIHVAVQNGVVTLTGSVDLYITKLYAEKKAAEVRHGAVHDEIQVTGPMVPDQELKAALKQAIDHRNIPGAAEASRWISIRVRNGIVTLSGHANESTVSAVSIAVAKTPGVRDLILRLLVYSDTLPTTPVEWPPAGASVGGISTQ